MDYIVPFCGSAKTSLHNQVFLEGVKSAVLSGKKASSGGICKGEAVEGEYRGWSDKEREIGLKALGRVYAGWGFSQAFYRERLYESVLGFKDLEDFMVNFWEAWALSKGTYSLSSYLFDLRSSSAWFSPLTFHRPREHACDALHVAVGRLLSTRAI